MKNAACALGALAGGVPVLVLLVLPFLSFPPTIRRFVEAVVVVALICGALAYIQPKGGWIWTVLLLGPSLLFMLVLPLGGHSALSEEEALGIKTLVAALMLGGGVGTLAGIGLGSRPRRLGA